MNVGDIVEVCSDDPAVGAWWNRAGKVQDILAGGGWIAVEFEDGFAPWFQTHELRLVKEVDA